MIRLDKDTQWALCDLTEELAAQESWDKLDLAMATQDVDSMRAYRVTLSRILFKNDPSMLATIIEGLTRN